MNTRDFLDAVKRRHRLRSDYALAKFLGWRQPRISTYRNTPRELDDAACIKVADALDLPCGYVLATIAAARTKDKAARAEWTRVARLLKAGSRAAAACVVAGVLVAANDARATSPAPTHSLIAHSIHYAHYRVRRFICRAWLGVRAFCDSLACSLFPHSVI